MPGTADCRRPPGSWYMLDKAGGAPAAHMHQAARGCDVAGWYLLHSTGDTWQGSEQTCVLFEVGGPGARIAAGPWGLM